MYLYNHVVMILIFMYYNLLITNGSEVACPIELWVIIISWYCVLSCKSKLHSIWYSSWPITVRLSHGIALDDCNWFPWLSSRTSVTVLGSEPGHDDELTYIIIIIINTYILCIHNYCTHHLKLHKLMVFRILLCILRLQWHPCSTNIVFKQQLP